MLGWDTDGDIEALGAWKREGDDEATR